MAKLKLNELNSVEKLSRFLAENPPASPNDPIAIKAILFYLKNLEKTTLALVEIISEAAQDEAEAEATPGRQPDATPFPAGASAAPGGAKVTATPAQQGALTPEQEAALTGDKTVSP